MLFFPGVDGCNLRVPGSAVLKNTTEKLSALNRVLRAFNSQSCRAFCILIVLRLFDFFQDERYAYLGCVLGL